MAEADIQTIYQSNAFAIRNFVCRCTSGGISSVEYSQSFNISFVRTGNFSYHVFKNEFDAYNGFALVDKPGCEHRVGHNHHVPDKCTIFDFSDRVYYELLETVAEKNSFFLNRDIFSALVMITPEVDYIHHLVLQKVFGESDDLLSVDCLVFEMLDWFVQRLADNSAYIQPDARLKKLHLETIERSKQFITDHFEEQLSLEQISNHCHVSPFHFSRIFKSITHLSPYRFLQDIRLKNAELLLRNPSSLSVFEIGLKSGFNSAEHFSAAFRQKFGVAPSQYQPGKNPKNSKIS
jgi:AraC-like DNA-binding protein